MVDDQGDGGALAVPSRTFPVAQGWYDLREKTQPTRKTENNIGSTVARAQVEALELRLDT